jgi:hypothetical protein
MRDFLLIVAGISICLVVETGCAAVAIWVLPDAKRVLPAGDGDAP